MQPIDSAAWTSQRMLDAIRKLYSDYITGICTVGGQPFMPHWAASFKAASNCGSLHPPKGIHHEGRPFQQQKLEIILCQPYFVRPLRLCPFFLCHTDLIQRCPSIVAKYCAKFSWCSRQNSNHDLDAVSRCSSDRFCPTHVARRSSHLTSVQLHGFVQKHGSCQRMLPSKAWTVVLPCCLV